MPSKMCGTHAEPLERRRLLAAVSWDGGGNGIDWTDPLNWSTDALPGPADDVTIDVAGSPTIRYWGGVHTDTIQSLHCAEAFRMVLGRLEITGDSVISGPMTHDGGWFFGDGDVSITQSLTLSGGIMAGEGTTRIEPGATLMVDDDLREFGRRIENAGTATFVNSSFYWGAFSFSSYAVLHNLAGATVTLFGFNNWFHNGPCRIENAGTIIVTSHLNSGVPFDNTGTLHLQGANATFGPVLTQLDGQTLTGGTWIVEDGATLSFHSLVVLRTNQADVTLNGPGAAFPNIDTLRTNAGRFALGGGCSFNASPAGGTFTNTGTLDLGAGSTLAVSGQFVQTGSATLTTAVAAPGSVGKITATGAATLNGTLDAALAGGFVPTLGDTFDVVNASSRTGVFASVNRPQANGVMLDPVYSATGVMLHAVPDTIAPAVTAAEFAFDTPTQRITVGFSEDVSASLAASDLLLENLTSGQSVPSGNIAISYDASTNEAVFLFPGFANGVLPDGNYRATLAAADVSDAGGNVLAQDFVLNSFFLNGDANRDGRVNLADFNILAANFGQSPRDFTQGDFTYDGQVNLADFNVLASRFGMALSPAAGQAALETRGTTQSDDADDDEKDGLLA